MAIPQEITDTIYFIISPVRHFSKLIIEEAVYKRDKNFLIDKGRAEFITKSVFRPLPPTFPFPFLLTSPLSFLPLTSLRFSRHPKYARFLSFLRQRESEQHAIRRRSARPPPSSLRFFSSFLSYLPP